MSKIAAKTSDRTLADSIGNGAPRTPLDPSGKTGLPSGISESDFLSALRLALNAPTSPVRVYRINSGDIVYVRNGFKNRFFGAPAGTGDLVGWVVGHGWYIEIETKARKGRLRKAQLAHQVAAAKMGWLYVAVRAGVDLEASVVAAVAAVRAAIASKAMQVAGELEGEVMRLRSFALGVVDRDLKPANVVPLRRRAR